MSGPLVRGTYKGVSPSGEPSSFSNTTTALAAGATITNPLSLINSQFVYPYNCKFANGLTIVTSAADDITVVYR